MKQKIYVLVLAAFLVGLTVSPLYAGLEPGRVKADERGFSIGLNVGSIRSIDGNVRETKRAGASGITTEGRFLEEYDLGDFGYNSAISSFGLNMEWFWKYITLGFDFSYFEAEASARAKRVYAIGVDGIRFGGETYDYMLIEDGQRFSSDIEAAIAELRVQWTPFHIALENGFAFTPWIFFGIYGLGGEVSINAGPAKGVTTYEIDPFPYVVGGKGDTTVGALAPELGLGAEVRWPVFYVGQDVAELVIEGNYAFLDVAASSGDFGVNARNEKNVDLDFVNFEARVKLEIPLNETTEFFVGAGLKHVEADAEIEAKRRPPGETTTEKYDKVAEMSIDTFYVMAGFLF